jgi:hypothetical protein
MNLDGDRVTDLELPCAGPVAGQCTASEVR